MRVETNAPIKTNVQDRTIVRTKQDLAGLADNEAGGFPSPIRRLTPTNDIDPAAKALADRFGGQPSVKIEGFGNREFDMVSDQFVGQAFGPKTPGKAAAFEVNAKNFLNKSRRTQIRATLEAAQVTQRQALFEFSGGKPSQAVLDFIQRNAQRQGVSFQVNLVD
jgi:hypothetical protein